MKTDFHIFELPVYRLTSEAFNKESERAENKIIKEYNLDDQTDPDIKRLVLKQYFHSYKYNDVLGWIQIFVDRSYIRAEYYFVPIKNARRGFKKDYRYLGKAFELWLTKNDTSEVIFRLLLESIKSLKSSGSFRNRFIDTERLENIGKYIDWAKLMLDNAE